jgi:uncharacterized membrane protein
LVSYALGNDFLGEEYLLESSLRNRSSKKCSNKILTKLHTWIIYLDNLYWYLVSLSLASGLIFLIFLIFLILAII